MFGVPYAEQPVLLPCRRETMSVIPAITLLCHRRTNNGDIVLISVCVCVCVCMCDGISKTMIISTENFKLPLLEPVVHGLVPTAPPKCKLFISMTVYRNKASTVPLPMPPCQWQLVMY